GERHGGASGEVTETEDLDQLIGAAPPRVASEPVEGTLRDEFVADPVVLAGTVLLADGADRGSHRRRLRGDVIAAHGGVAGAGLEQGGEHAQGRGLAGSVGPQERGQRSGWDVHGEVTD